MVKNTLKTSVRIDENMSKDYDRMAEESHKSKTDLINAALQLYRDVYYGKNKATVLNDNVVAVMQSIVEGMEHRLNNRTNQLLSELAIQEAIIAQELAYSLNIKGDDTVEYRKHALEFLKVNQRILRLDELIEK